VGIKGDALQITLEPAGQGALPRHGNQGLQAFCLPQTAAFTERLSTRTHHTFVDLYLSNQFFFSLPLKRTIFKQYNCLTHVFLSNQVCFGVYVSKKENKQMVFHPVLAAELH